MRLATRLAIFALAAAAPLGAIASAGAEPPPRQHPPIYADIDLGFLDAGFSIAAHLGGGLYAGAGVSLGPALTYNTFRRYPIEWVDAHVFLRYEPARPIQLDLGARASYFEELKLCIFGPCGAAPTGALLGAYAGAAFGTRGFKLGPRVELAERSDTREGGFLFYPLMMRVELTP